MRQLPIFAIFYLAAAGCGGTAKYDAVVTGTVLVDGELANSGLVTFHPVDGGNVAIGRIHADGSYSLRTGQGNLHQEDGGTVASGAYVVTVSITGPPAIGAQVAEGGPPIPGPSLVAAKYASAQTSDLKHMVKPGEQVIVLELERAEVTPAEVGEAVDETEVADDATTRGEAAGAKNSPAEAQALGAGDADSSTEASAEAEPAVSDQPAAAAEEKSNP